MATQKQAKDECRILGFSLNRTPGGDFRLAPLGKTPARAEAEASYHETAAEALDTARAIVKDVSAALDERLIDAVMGCPNKPTCYTAAWATVPQYDGIRDDAYDAIGSLLDFCAPQVQLIGRNLDRLIERAKVQAEADWRTEQNEIETDEPGEGRGASAIAWREVDRGERSESNAHARFYRHHMLFTADAAANYDANPDQYESEPELGLVILEVESAD